MSDIMVSVKNVTLSFDNEVILNGINLEMEKGKIYGFVGRNGSGKTVLMKCICGFMYPQQGSIIVADKMIGRDIDFPESIGIIIETPGFLPHFNGMDNLMLLAMIRNKIGKKEISDAMKRVGLNPKMKKAVSKYSLGMRQRLGIAQAIMENPEFLILDEPMNGLDSQGVEDIRNLLTELKQSGKTIMLASHNSEDINALCDVVFEVKNKKITQIK